MEFAAQNLLALKDLLQAEEPESDSDEDKVIIFSHHHLLYKSITLRLIQYYTFVNFFMLLMPIVFNFQPETGWSALNPGSIGPAKQTPKPENKKGTNLPFKSIETRMKRHISYSNLVIMLLYYM
jgi:hypothetical protein